MGWNLVPSFKKERQSFAKGTASIWKNINNIWDQLNVEYKDHNLKVPRTALTAATPSIFDLSEINQGITGGTGGAIDKGYRDGDQVRVTSINIKGRIYPSTNSTRGVACDVFLVKHYDNFLGDTILFENIYDKYSSDNLMLQQRVSDRVATHKIVARRRIKISEVGQNDDQQYFSMYAKFTHKSGSRIEWEGASENDPNNGKYYLIVVPDTNVANDVPGIEFSSRMTYVDN